MIEHPDSSTLQLRSISRRLALRSDAQPNEASLAAAFPTTPLVSVILPIYNDTTYLRQAVASVVKERSIPLELIVVDDGSSVEIEISDQDKRIHVIRQENQGLSGALATGFKAATGAYFTWISADNFFKDRSLLSMARSLRASGNGTLVYGNVELINDAGVSFTNSSYRPSDQNPERTSHLMLPHEVGGLFAYDDNFVNACFMFRRRAYEFVGGYARGLRGIEDFEMWLRLTAFFPAFHIETEDPLYCYRLHSESMTSTIDAMDLAEQTSKLRRAAAQARESAESRFLYPELRAVLDEIAPQALFSLARTEAALREIYSPIVPDLSFAPRELSGSCAPILPPIHPNPLIKRARDSFFGALPQPNQGGWSFVVIPPENNDQDSAERVALSTVSQLERMRPRPDVHLLGFGRKESIVRSLSGNGDKSFRTMIISDSECNSHPDPDYYRARALMFILSSTDALVFPSDGSVDSILELRYVAALAALAGIPLFVPIESDFGFSGPNGTLSRSILQSYAPAPHIHFIVGDSPLDRNVHTELRARSLDAWLETVGSGGLVRELKTALYSRAFERVFPGGSSQPRLVSQLWRKIAG